MGEGDGMGRKCRGGPSDAGERVTQVNNAGERATWGASDAGGELCVRLSIV